METNQFANLITSIREKEIPSGEVEIEIGGRSILGLSLSYAESTGILTLEGSLGHLQVVLGGRE